MWQVNATELSWQSIDSIDLHTRTARSNTRAVYSRTQTPRHTPVQNNIQQFFILPNFLSLFVHSKEKFQKQKVIKDLIFVFHSTLFSRICVWGWKVIAIEQKRKMFSKKLKHFFITFSLMSVDISLCLFSSHLLHFIISLFWEGKRCARRCNIFI